MNPLFQTLSIRKNGREILRAPLPEDQALIGRSPVCDIILRAPQIATIHFLLEKQEVDMMSETPTPLWMLFDISSEKVLSGRTPQIRSAEGVVLGNEPATMGSLEFALINDKLAATSLEKGALLRNIREVSEKQTQHLKHHAPHLNAIECVLYERQSHSVVGLRHLPLNSYRGKNLKPFSRSLPELDLKLPRTDGEPSVFQVAKRIPFRLFNRGVAFEKEDNPSGFLLQKKDFIEIQTTNFDVYLRYVNFEHFEIPQDPRLKWKAGLLAAVFLVFAIASLGLIHGFMPEKPKERERVVTLKTDQPVAIREIPPPPPTPAPAPPKQIVAKPAPPAMTAPKQVAPPAPAPAPPKQVAPQPAPVAVAPPQPAPKPQPITAPKPIQAPSVASKKPVPARTAAPAAPADAEWRSALSKLKRYGSAKKTQVSAETLLASSNSNTDQPQMLGSTTSPRKLEDGQESLRSATTKEAPNLSANVSAKGGDQAVSGVAVDTSNIRIGLDSGSESDISGGLTKVQVQETINGYRNEIRTCYQKQLVLNPKIQGRVLYSWIISPNGQVNSVEVKSFTINSKEVRNCIQQVIRKMKYPTAATAISTKVLYPFYLAPY